MIVNAVFRDVMRVTHLYSKISLVLPEDSVSVDEVLKAVKNVVYRIHHINKVDISANTISDMRSCAVKLNEAKTEKQNRREPRDYKMSEGLIS